MQSCFRIQLIYPGDIGTGNQLPVGINCDLNLAVAHLASTRRPSVLPLVQFSDLQFSNSHSHACGVHTSSTPSHDLAITFRLSL